ncbi:CRISPR-associated endonuclease Cas2 [Egibacter rhizosphaerae]|uniref:CRISPR-associated endoribonuclease Cas2 n=1 Tax=Egibacter rhizosphaerae TaxID=1670831 RepID=A0A411YEL3_9ACTN|nr:CRISPR-associated endonuclease Cas2 [Egibacter rhizosphaerae]QBI19648.1 CRISPR-associated endonuclease Cas2 [Egibacter rhizosphaerae]
MDLLVAYDVATRDREGERRLAEVAAVCERYGVRVQYSVFECRLTATAAESLVVELEATILPSDDSVLIYRFPGDLRTSRQALGRRRGSGPAGPWIV